MNSHDRRIQYRAWKRRHAEEIETLIRTLRGPQRFEMAYLHSDGTIEMCPKRFCAFGMPVSQPPSYWQRFLKDRGVRIPLE